MWQPTESFLIKYHIAGSLAVLICGLTIIIIYLVPSLFPDIYRFMVDDRIAVIIPYLLFIALSQSIFSIWFFLFRK